MKPRHPIVAATATLLLLASAPAALSQMPKTMMAGPTPQAMEQNGVRYVVGGVGEQSRKALEQMASQYNTQLIFASGPDRHFVVNVDVKVTDASGKTRMHLKDAGPMLYAQLPPGTYNVVATYEGAEKMRRIDVRDGGAPAREGFRW